MKSCVLIILGFLISFSVSSQFSWSGHVVDEEGKALSYVNILLLNSKDSTFIKGDFTDVNGVFEINNNSIKDALIQVHMIGYEDKYILVSSEVLDLGTIILSESKALMDEVQIVAKKPLYEQQIDRTVINVENSVINAGNSALNVLSRSPSVLFDRSNQQISLMGNQGVIVMINNKPIRMEGEELINYLESLSSDQIKSIELIPNPPASYDAQGNAGIININLSRHKNKGFTGNAAINTGYGNRLKFGTSLALNHTNEKLYTFMNLSSNNTNSLEIFKNELRFIINSSEIESNNYTERDYFIGLNTIDAGAYYDLTEEHQIGTSITLQHRNWQLNSDAISQRSEDGNTVEITNLNNEENLLRRLVFNGHYIYKPNEKNSLSVDLDYINFRRNNPTIYTAKSVFADGNSINNVFHTNSETPLNVLVGSLDYSTQLSSKIKGELGIKLTQSNFSNDASYSDEVNGELIFDPFFTDIFTLNENIGAAYVSVNGQITPKLSFKSGLRYESYLIDLSSENKGQVVNRQNARVYPNVFLKYQLSKNTDATISYVERIERPGFLIIAPAFYFYNQYELFTGNPEIIPSLSKRIKVDLKWKTTNISLSGSQVNNPIFQFTPTFIEERNILASQASQANIGYFSSLSISQPFTISNYVKSRINVNMNYLDQRPIIRGKELRSTSYNYNIILTNSFEINPTLSAEINSQFFSRMTYSAIQIRERIGVDFGLSKTIGSHSKLTLNVTDILDKASEFRVITDTPEINYYRNGHFNFEGRVFRLTLNTKFGRKEYKHKDKRSSKSAEEIGRTQ